MSDTSVRPHPLFASPRALLDSARLLPGVASSTRAAGGQTRSHTVNAIVDGYDPASFTTAQYAAPLEVHELVAFPQAHTPPRSEGLTDLEIDAIGTYALSVPRNKIPPTLLSIVGERSLTPAQYLRILAAIPEDQRSQASRMLAFRVEGLSANHMQMVADLLPNDTDAHCALVDAERARRGDHRYVAKASPDVVNTLILAIHRSPQNAWMHIRAFTDRFSLHFGEAMAIYYAGKDAAQLGEFDLRTELHRAVRDTSRNAFTKTAPKMWGPTTIVTTMIRDRKCAQDAIAALDAKLPAGATSSPTPIREPTSVPELSDLIKTLIGIIGARGTPNDRKDSFGRRLQEQAVSPQELLTLAVAARHTDPKYVGTYVALALSQVSSPIAPELVASIEPYLTNQYRDRCCHVQVRRQAENDPNLKPEATTETVAALVADANRSYSAHAMDVLREAPQWFSFTPDQVDHLCSEVRALEQDKIRGYFAPQE